MRVDATASNNFATIPELADLWRVTHAHVYRLDQRGDLPAFRIGGRIIVDRNAAKNFLERNATTAKAA